MSLGCLDVAVVVVSVSRLALWVKFSAEDILKHFSYCSQKTGFDISCKLSPMETVCMQCQILFSWKKKENINLSSAVWQRVPGYKTITGTTPCIGCDGGN